MSMKNVSLLPTEMRNQPAQYNDRYKILLKLHEQLLKCRLKVDPGRLKRMAIELELRVAKSSTTSQSYRFHMSILLRDLIKYKGDFRQIKIAGKPVSSKGNKCRPVTHQAEIKKKDVAMKKLEEMVIDPKILLKHKYIMSRELPDDYTGSSLYASCARCNTKFEKKNIMENTLCKYHPQKKVYNRETKTHVFPCCGESTTSTSFMRLGCEKANHHVFKEDTYQELREISDFLKTTAIEGKKNVLALDCEMAFTSKGFEMVRLTIVDFFSSKTLFDEIVEPFGDVVDLNTLFSGIHVGDMKKAIPYEGIMDRILTSDLINRNSILIGHGLENDLNVMRIIHDRIIDTAILYSDGKYKTSLKNLTFETLSEKIQTGEHDSSQDAIATMNVIKKKIGIAIDRV
ncbi:RNA exonuclease 3, partial [Maudiozyma exigua]